MQTLSRSSSRPPDAEGGRPAPAVSAIVIFRDAQRFLAEAVESVLAQDFGEWELILVDDGSTDSSTAIAREYAARHPHRIRYVEHEGHRNRGMSASRNAGVAHARGALVAFLDSDDVWMPGKLRAQMALMQSHPEAQIVFGRTRFWFGWTGAPADMARDFTWALDHPADRLVRPPALLHLAPLGNCLKPSMSNFMARREFLEADGRFEDEFTNLREDYVFWVKAFFNATVYQSHETWDSCRHHPASWSSVRLAPGQERRESTRYLQWVVDYLGPRCRGEPYLAAVVSEFRARLAYPRAHRWLPAFQLARLRRRLARLATLGVAAEWNGWMTRRRRGAW